MSRTLPEPPAPRVARPHPVTGFLTTVLLILVIVLVAAGFAIRTRGGCDLLADFLRDRTGLDAVIGGARFALPYDLVLENVRTRGEGGTNGAFEAREVRLEWLPGGAPVVKARGARLALAAGAPGGWQPAPFAGLGDLRDVRQTIELFREWPGLALDVREGAIVWATGGTNTTAIEGLTLQTAPLRLPGRQARYFELQASRVQRAGGIVGRAVHRTWISAEGNAYLELEYRGLWDETPPAGPDWWSVPAPAGPAEGVPQ